MLAVFLLLLMCDNEDVNNLSVTLLTPCFSVKLTEATYKELARAAQTFCACAFPSAFDAIAVCMQHY